MVARIRELLSKRVWYEHQPEGRVRSQGMAQVTRELRSFPKDLVRKEIAAKKQRRVYANSLDRVRPSPPPITPALQGSRWQSTGVNRIFGFDHDAW